MAKFLLIGCLTAPMLVTYVWLSYEKAVKRHEVKEAFLEGTDIDDLVKFSFSDEEMQEKLSWVHESEFEYAGHMYDVVRLERVNDQTVMHCWPDDVETALNTQLQNLLSRACDKSPVESQQFQHLEHFLKTLHCPVMTAADEIFRPGVTPIPYCQVPHQKGYLQPCTPPPESC